MYNIYIYNIVIYSSVCIPPMIGITVGLSHNLLIPPLSVFGQPFSPHITNGIICIYCFKVLVYCLFPINPIIFLYVLLQLIISSKANFAGAFSGSRNRWPVYL